MSLEPAHWRPRASLDVLKLRARMLRNARAWFEDAGLMEVETPALGAAPASDANVASVRVALAADPRAPRYLQTSPEYAMKRLLAAGAPDIYQICRAFRDGEAGRLHQPEFTLVEWYRHTDRDGGRDVDDLAAIVEDTLAFLSAMLAPHVELAAPERNTYAGLFREFLGVDALDAGIAELSRVASDAPLAVATSRETLLDWLLATRILPALGGGRLQVIERFPAAQAALARLDAQAPGSALRFEIAYEGIELANGFVELADPVEQRRRFERERARTRDAGRAAGPLDEALLAALAAGLPDCAGVAVGFDRLVMVAAGCDDIRRVQAFPVVEDAT